MELLLDAKDFHEAQVYPSGDPTMEWRETRISWINTSQDQILVDHFGGLARPPQVSIDYC